MSTRLTQIHCFGGPCVEGTGLWSPYRAQNFSSNDIPIEVHHKTQSQIASDSIPCCKKPDRGISAVKTRFQIPMFQSIATRFCSRTKKKNKTKPYVPFPAGLLVFPLPFGRAFPFLSKKMEVLCLGGVFQKRNRGSGKIASNSWPRLIRNHQ